MLLLLPCALRWMRMGSNNPQSFKPHFGYARYYCRHTEACTAMKLIGFISPARRYVDCCYNRLISSALTAAVRLTQSG